MSRRTGGTPVARARDLRAGTGPRHSHALGWLPGHRAVSVDLHEIGCDFYATNCYKWMLSPMGTGFLYVRKDAQQVFEAAAAAACSRWYGPRQYETGSPGARALPGSRRGSRFPGRHRRAAGHRRGGGTESGNRCANASTPFPGVRVLGSRRARNPDRHRRFSRSRAWKGTKSLTHSRNRWRIAQRATNINKPSGVRISVAFYTTDSELDALVDAVTTLAGGRMGFGNR